jgi:hypothetical protein
MPSAALSTCGGVPGTGVLSRAWAGRGGGGGGWGELRRGGHITSHHSMQLRPLTITPVHSPEPSNTKSSPPRASSFATRSPCGSRCGRRQSSAPLSALRARSCSSSPRYPRPLRLNVS